MTNSKPKDTNFNWHAEVGDREMSGTAIDAVQRDSRQASAVDLMKRDPHAGTPKAK
jgi:hypothetical protein